MADDDPSDALLHDMLAYSEEAVVIIGHLAYERYSGDRIRMLAVERVLEIVAEAARHVGETRQLALAEIPWKKIIGQRNVLAHVYGEIDHFQLYRTVREDLPLLIANLRKRVA